MHRSASHVAAELVACIRCNECLNVCPALAAPLPVAAVNRQTLDGPVSPEVARFAQSCILCGACVPVCPVGLHRDAMMLWLKMRLLRGEAPVAAPLAGTGTGEDGLDIGAAPPVRPDAYRRAFAREAERPAPWVVSPRGQAVVRRQLELRPTPFRNGTPDGDDWSEGW